MPQLLGVQGQWLWRQGTCPLFVLCPSRWMCLCTLREMHIVWWLGFPPFLWVGWNNICRRVRAKDKLEEGDVHPLHTRSGCVYCDEEQGPYLDSWFIAQASPALHANLLLPPPPNVKPVTALFLPLPCSSTHQDNSFHIVSSSPHPALHTIPTSLPLLFHFPLSTLIWDSSRNKFISWMNCVNFLSG